MSAHNCNLSTPVLRTEIGLSQVQVLRVLRPEMYWSQVKDQLELHSIDQVCQGYTQVIKQTNIHDGLLIGIVQGEGERAVIVQWQ